MGITIHYHAKAKQIHNIIEFFNHYKEYNPKIVDFPFHKKWVKRGAVYQPDYEENWDKYHLCIGGKIKRYRYNGRLPDHYRGIILELDKGCEPLWFTFGLYPDSDYKWNCDEFTKTQFAKKGFVTHVEVIDRLKELEPMVDYLKVKDEAKLWGKGDLEYSAHIFRQMEKALKVFGNYLKEIGKEKGFDVRTGWDE